MKRLLVLMLFLLIALVVGCSQDGKAGEKNTNTQANANETNKDGDKGKDELEDSGPLALSIQLEGYGTTPSGVGNIQAEIEKRTDTKLEVNWIPYDDYESRFNVQLGASSDLPDIIASVMPKGQLFSSQVIQAIEAGIFKDLTPFIEDPEFKTKYPHLAEYPDEVWEAMRFDGKIYAMPRFTQPYAARSGVIVREDLMKEAGLEEPKTMDELADFLIDLSKKNNIYGLHTPVKDMDSVNYKPIAVAFTGIQDWGVDEDGNYFYQAFMPEYKDYILWMKKLFDNGAIDPEFALEQDGSNFSEGNSVAKIHDWWSWKQGGTKHTFSSAFREKNPDVRAWGLLPIEGPKAYALSVKPFDRPALVHSRIADEDIPKVLAFFDYTASQEHRDLTLYGIEGDHHTVENGEIVLDKEKFDAESVGHWWVMFQNQLETTERHLDIAKDQGVSDTDLARMKEMAEIAEEKAREDELGMPHWAVKSNTYTKRWGTVTKDLNDNIINVIMGRMSIEDWDKYVQQVVESKDYKQIQDEFKNN